MLLTGSASHDGRGKVAELPRGNGLGDKPGPDK